MTPPERARCLISLMTSLTVDTSWPPRLDHLKKTMNYEFHELAMLMPPMTESELDSLREDIEKNGVQTPITLFEGKILDGRNRATCCMILGVDPPTEEYTGNNPVAFVMSRNVHRRHLSESQRAILVAKAVNMPPYRPKNKVDTCPPYSRENAASDAGVSPRTITRAIKVLKEADPETVNEVVKGGVTLGKITKEIAKSKPKPAPPIPSEPALPFEEPEGLWEMYDDEQEEPRCSEQSNNAGIFAISIFQDVSKLKERIREFRKTFPNDHNRIDTILERTIDIFYESEIERWLERR